MIAILLAISCNYSYYGAPFAKVDFSQNDDGSLSPSAMISTGGSGVAHKETLTPERLAADELIHAWISKESADNSIELIVYKEMKAEGNSVLINSRVPFGKEVWGSCSGRGIKVNRAN